MTKRTWLGVGVTLLALSVLAPGRVAAESYDCDTSDHPARYLVYPIHAVGKGIETFVTRPIHWLVSQRKLRYVFGHTSKPRREDYTGNFDLYQRYQY
ncbi:MAG: hypothetical protein N2Z21_04645 [Candidatus Sumerlaeaceae bacterium]|nr:hypothetical protein [Candidatus Sumerlaeaceae bacterium]